MYIIIASLDIVSFDISLCMYILQGSGITRNGIFNVYYKLYLSDYRYVSFKCQVYYL